MSSVIISLEKIKKLVLTNIPPTELCLTGEIMNRHVYTRVKILCNEYTAHILCHPLGAQCMCVSECAHMFTGAVISTVSHGDEERRKLAL